MIGSGSHGRRSAARRGPRRRCSSSHRASRRIALCRAAAASLRARLPRNTGRERAGYAEARSPRRMTRALLDRLKLDDKRVDSMARALEDIARLARSHRHGARRVDPAERHADSAPPRAAGRDRDHLREPPERHRGRGRAVPEIRQRRDPAGRIGERAFERARCMRAWTGLAVRGPAERLHPAGAHHRSRGRRLHAGARWPSTSTSSCPAAARI